MDAVMWGDAFRVANLAAGSGALGLSLWITANYAVAYRRSKRSGEAEWRGLLPRHVLLIGLSYDMLIILLMTAFVRNVGSPITWRHPGFFIALLLGLLALRDMTKSQRYRKTHLPGEPTPTEER